MRFHLDWLKIVDSGAFEKWRTFHIQLRLVGDDIRCYPSNMCVRGRKSLYALALRVAKQNIKSHQCFMSIRLEFSSMMEQAVDILS